MLHDIMQKTKVGGSLIWYINGSEKKKIIKKLGGKEIFVTHQPPTFNQWIE